MPLINAASTSTSVTNVTSSGRRRIQLAVSAFALNAKMSPLFIPTNSSQMLVNYMNACGCFYSSIAIQLIDIIVCVYIIITSSLQRECLVNSSAQNVTIHGRVEMPGRDEARSVRTV